MLLIQLSAVTVISATPQDVAALTLTDAISTDGYMYQHITNLSQTHDSLPLSIMLASRMALLMSGNKQVRPGGHNMALIKQVLGPS